MTERFIRTDTCGSSSSARRAILHEEAGYIYADCPFANFKPLAVRRRTIHYRPRFEDWGGSASGGSRRFIGQLPSGGENLRWSPDGKGVQYLLTRSGANVWEQPLAGGDPHPVTKFASGLIFSFAWSRDGKQLLLSKGSDNSDVILISNFR